MQRNSLAVPLPLVAPSPALSAARTVQPEAPSRRWLALGILLVGPFLGVVDFFIANLAVPVIRTMLHATFAEIELVLVGYGMAYAICLITGGRLGDIYGRRRVFLLGLAGFVLTSAGCGTAGSADVLVVWRVFQGMAAAVMFPQALSYARVAFAPKERRLAFAAYGGVVGLASIVGQAAGGTLLGANLFGLEWRPIFLVNVPLGVVILLAGWKLLPESRSPSALRLDLVGSVLVAIALFLFAYPLMEGREAGWPAWAWISLVFSVPAFALFLRYERWRAATMGSPLVDPALFRDRAFLFGLLATLVYFAGHSSMLLMLTMYLELGRDLSPAAAGLALAPFSLGFIGGSLLAPRLAGRFQAHRALYVGAAIVAFSLLLMGLRSWGADGLGSVLFSLPATLAVYGLGRGLLTGPLLNLILSQSEGAGAGAAAGVISTAQQLANSLGVALIGLLLFGILPAQPSPTDYTFAFVTSCGTNLLMLVSMAFFISRLSPRLMMANLPESKAPGV